MGLFSIIRKNKLKEREMRVLILYLQHALRLTTISGLDNAGKTTIVKKLMAERVDTVSPTLGFEIKSLDVTVANRLVKVNFWDVGGQKTIRAYWKNYFEATDGIIWVVDSADAPERFVQARMELFSIMQEQKLQGASVVVLANKQDLSSAKSVQEIASMLALEDICQGRCWKIFPCSAYSTNSPSEGFSWLVEEVTNRLFLLD
jgi:ADP-ribosylation factor-like protein 2